MENVIIKFEKYISDTLGLTLRVDKWEGEKSLPFFLRDLYSFYEVSLLNSPCLIMAARAEAEETPATICKHMKQVREKWDAEVIYLQRAVSSYNRMRLIEHKVPFVVPGNQMYFPLLGIDLREHFRKIRSTNKKFSPSTQVVVLHALMGEERVFTPSGLANSLGYTVMTLTRALDELESLGLGEVSMEGRERVLRFSDSKESLWHRAQEFMRSPVKKRLYLLPTAGEWPGVEAGLTALARYSLLAPPRNPVYALSMEDWKSLKQRNNITQLAIPEPQSFEVEIWNYTPHRFATGNAVDRLSLYLSLLGTKDERVASALEEMMEGIKW